MNRNLLLCLATLLLAAAPSAIAQVSPASESRSATERSTAGKIEPGGEDEETQFKHSPSVQWLAKMTGLSIDRAYQLSVLTNFAVVAVAVLWISRKKLPGVFRDRTSSIQRAMQEAQKASAEARERLAAIEARLSKLDTEITDMRTNAEKEAAAEEQRLKASAEEEARHIAESAGQEIAASAKAARRDLMAYAAELAVSLAARQVKVDTATDQSLVRNFAENLTGANGAPGQDKK